MEGMVGEMKKSVEAAGRCMERKRGDRPISARLGLRRVKGIGVHNLVFTAQGSGGWGLRLDTGRLSRG